MSNRLTRYIKRTIAEYKCRKNPPKQGDIVTIGGQKWRITAIYDYPRGMSSYDHSYFARTLRVTKPNGKKVYRCEQFRNGNFTIPSESYY